MEIWRKYGEAATLLFPLIDWGGTDLETAAVHVVGDSQISKDEGLFGNTTNAFAHEGNGIYSLALTATEMQAARISITIVDQTAPKVFEDQVLLVATYGNAAAQHAFDLDTAQPIAASVTGNVGGSVASVTGSVGSIATNGITAASLAASADAEIADAVLDEAVEGTLTLRQLARIWQAVLAGKSTGGGTLAARFRDNADTINRVLASVDTNGNRTAVTLDVS